jgi:hypothetical protein
LEDESENIPKMRCIHCFKEQGFFSIKNEKNISVFFSRKGRRELEADYWSTGAPR